jgi:hypothetical protein
MGLSFSKTVVDMAGFIHPLFKEDIRENFGIVTFICVLFWPLAIIRWMRK